MNIREQEYVLAIAKHKNIKRAAEELNISSPGLSVFLSSLENRMSEPLFHRVNKKFIPTDAGNLYISYAQQIAEFKKEYEKKLNFIKRGASGTIHLGIHPRRTAFLLPKALKIISERTLSVDVVIKEGASHELFDSLLEGELDLIIVNKEHPNPIFAYEWLYKDRLVGVLSPTLSSSGIGEKKVGGTLEWLDLKCLNGETFILQYPHQSIRWYTDAALRHSQACPGRVITIGNLETASQMAAEVLGIAFNMGSYANSFSYHRPVKYFFVGAPGLHVNYWIVRRKDKHMSSYVEIFVEILKQIMAEKEA